MRRALGILVTTLALAGCGADTGGSAKPQGGVLSEVEHSAKPVRCDLWAAPGGDDTASGSSERPFGSPQVLADHLRPGQTGCFRNGEYWAHRGAPYVIRFNHGGRRGKPITVRSAPGERASLTGIVYVPEGSDDVRIVDLDMHARHIDKRLSVGLQVMARRFVLQGVDMTNDRVTTSCVILGSNVGYGAAVAPVLRRNVFHDCGNASDGMLDHAIYVQHTVRAKIVDNVIVRSGGFGVHLYPNAQKTLVARNVIYDNGGGVIFAGDGSYASNGNVVRNNVIGGSHSRPEITSSFGGAVGRANSAYRNCLYPGQAPTDGPYGFKAGGNVVAKASPFLAALRLRSGSCRDQVGTDPVQGLGTALFAVASKSL